MQKRLAVVVLFSSFFSIVPTGAYFSGSAASWVVAEAAASEVSTPEAFTQVLYENLLARQSKFSIVYQGNYQDVYDGDMEDIFQKAYAIHQTRNSDDFDYLQYNISYRQLELPSISNQTEFVFEVTYREPAAWLQQVNEEAAAVEPSLRGSTDYETIRKVHDYIVNRITYDNSLTRYTAYQSLVEQSTVCQGYALLTYKMLTDLGIPCRFVSGYAGESHAWNIVKLGGQWYFLDTTWDDPIASSPQLRYDYFLVGSDKLSKDHTLDQKFRTSEFQRAYPISQTDYTPVNTEETVVPDAGGGTNAAAIDYRAIRQAIVSSLDKTTAGGQAAPMEAKMYDLAKHIILGVFAKQSDEDLAKLIAHDELFDQAFGQTYQKAVVHILQPMEQYTNSEAYLQTCSQRCQEVLDKTDIAHMEPMAAQKFKDDLAKRVSDEVLLEELDRISAAETDSLIQEIAQDVHTVLMNAS